MNDNYNNGIQIHDFWDGERMNGERKREPYTEEELLECCRLTGMPGPYLTYEELIESLVSPQDEANKELPERNGKGLKIRQLIKRIGGKSNGKIHK